MTISASDVSVPIQHADRFFIGGQWVLPSSDSTITVIDSHTEQDYLTVAEAQAADMDRAIAAAKEAFGPSLPVIPYDDEAAAIRLANGTWSGLCSSVWSGDTAHAMVVARQLRTGVTFFNNHNATAVDERAPFGGFNQSGIGRELGRECLLSFTETHVMAVPAGPPGH
jgi:acyl-CoA reductase-like NAD-dependent aldehyde dehydrogenase